jgi:GNAT superfamily N-acetyltransferase
MRDWKSIENRIKFQIPEFGIAKFHIPQIRQKLGSANKNREDQAMKRIQKFLRKPQAEQFLKPAFANGTHPYSGHCYVASQSLYHMLGGEEAGYSAYQMEHEGVSHWFLRNSKGRILDPTWRQFQTKPDYSQARRSAFLWTEDGISDRAEGMTALVVGSRAYNRGNHPLDETVEAFERQLEAEYGLSSAKPFGPAIDQQNQYHKGHINLYITDAGFLKLQSIRIPESERGRGSGTAIMQKIARFADAHGLTTVLTPAPLGGDSPYSRIAVRHKNRLTRWYRSLGFVHISNNKGRNKDYETRVKRTGEVRETMLRLPRYGSPNKPSFVVNSVGKGIRVLNHPDIVKNFKKSLRVRKKHRKAVLVPCASTKPFPQSPSHKHGYLKALKGKDLDIYVVSEPLGIVPYSWSNTYPNNDYDFPPKFVQGESREILVDRFAQWYDRVGKKYDELYLVLPSHHFSLVEEAGIPGVDLSISACRNQSCSDKVFRATTDEYIDFLKSNIPKS